MPFTLAGCQCRLHLHHQPWRRHPTSHPQPQARHQLHQRRKRRHKKQGPRSLRRPSASPLQQGQLRVWAPPPTRQPESGERGGAGQQRTGGDAPADRQSLGDHGLGPTAHELDLRKLRVGANVGQLGRGELGHREKQSWLLRGRCVWWENRFESRLINQLWPVKNCYMN